LAEKKFSIRALLFGDVRDFKKGMDQAKKSSNSFKGVLGNVGKTLKGLASSTLGFAAILYGAGKALMSIVRNNKDFQQSLSSLSAITGLTGEDLNFFAEQAKKTSKVTLQSANNIVKAYELIGSKRPELLQNKEALAEVTKQAIILSEATGGKLALEDAAKTLTTVMNQMNQSAAESGRIINIVAAGSQKGSADALYLSEAFEKAGTTANIMGLSVEETTGAFEALAPFFSKASVLGNSFDKVLLKLREKNIGFTNGVFDMNDAIDQLRIKYEQGQSAADIFGVEHAKLAELLVINQKEFNTYTEAVTDTTIALEQQATQNDNLANNWKRLVNIVQSATLSSSGTGVLNSIVKGLIKATLAVQDFRNLFVENFNELIRKSSVFRAVFAVVTEALKLNFKGIIDSTLLVRVC
jgi:TP901 family phage tail tape measure protein